MIKSLLDIKTSYDEERYKNEIIFSIRKKDLYDEFPKLKEYDYELIDVYTDLSINPIDRKKRIDDIKNNKDRFIFDNHIDKDYDKMIYTCSKCHDTGFIDGKKCDCYREKELKLFANVSSFDKINDIYSFDNVDYRLFDQDIKGPNGTSYVDYMRLVIKLIKKQIDEMNEKPANALIYGPTGVGKTFIVKCAGKYAYEKKKTVMYLKMSDYIDYIFDKNKSINKNQFDIEEMSLESEFLIIDDFGKEYSTGFTSSKIYNLIDYRIDCNLSTVISTNFERKDLLDIYGDSLVSRVYNNFLVYRLYGKDLRSVKK